MNSRTKMRTMDRRSWIDFIFHRTIPRVERFLAGERKLPWRIRHVQLIDRVVAGAGLLTLCGALGVLALLMVRVTMTGVERLDIPFLLSYPSRLAEQAGILSAWVGTLWVALVTAVLAIPIGVLAAVYLEEYAPRGRFTKLLEINIANLAGVPSIIYGLLGLGLFVRFLDMGRSVLAGSATLALLVLPIVILATREALKAIPHSLRESSYALGATKWQTTWHQVLPAAAPGIFTGIILAISRAMGETAPLIMIGALTYVAFLPASPVTESFPFISLDGLADPFTVLPIQAFNWISRPQQAFQVNAAAAVVVLLGITLVMNGIAIWLRHRYNRNIHT